MPMPSGCPLEGAGKGVPGPAPTRPESTLCRGRFLICGTLALCSVWAAAQQKRAVTPRDCVAVRYLPDRWAGSSLEIDPTGAYVAYLVKEPHVESNQNLISL